MTAAERMEKNDSKNKIEFSELYETLYESCLNEMGEFHDIPLVLKDSLKKKRDLGLKKYGSNSFQSTLENCINSPAGLHAEEELLDAFNYLVHMMIQARFADNFIDNHYYIQDQLAGPVLDLLEILQTFNTQTKLTAGLDG